MVARDYIEARFPHLIQNYDALFREQFLPKEKKVLIPRSHDALRLISVESLLGGLS
jgi:hypothetical protein